MNNKPFAHTAIATIFWSNHTAFLTSVTAAIKGKPVMYVQEETKFTVKRRQKKHIQPKV
jgi:hypothetical protein